MLVIVREIVNSRQQALFPAASQILAHGGMSTRFLLGFRVNRRFFT